MASSRSQNATQRLTGDSIVLTVRPARRIVGKLCWLVILAVIALAAATFVNETKQWPWWPQWLSVSNFYIAEESTEKTARQWQKELDNLQKEIDRMRLDREVDAAIRHELEQTIANLQEQIKAANLQLNFVKSKQVP